LSAEVVLDGLSHTLLGGGVLLRRLTGCEHIDRQGLHACGEGNEDDSEEAANPLLVHDASPWEVNAGCLAIVPRTIAFTADFARFGATPFGASSFEQYEPIAITA
jgi:hypothetical protein